MLAKPCMLWKDLATAIVAAVYKNRGVRWIAIFQALWGGGAERGDGVGVGVGVRAPPSPDYS